MLIKYKVGNFLSFNEIESFSMIASKDDSHMDHVNTEKNPNLLYSSFIYGPNAAGKSNFIKSIDYSKNKILDLDDDDFYFKLIVDYSHKKIEGERNTNPSYFEYIIEINNIVYSYGFQIDTLNDVYTSEWLYTTHDNKEEKIFEFEYEDEGSLEFNNRQILNKYLESHKNITFLKYLAESKSRAHETIVAKRVLDWFKFNLIVEESSIDERKHSISKEFFDKISDQLSELDTGIDKIEFVQNFDENNYEKHECGVSDPFMIQFKDGEMMIPENDIQMWFKHGHYSFDVKYSNESLGTRRIIYLLTVLYENKCFDDTFCDNSDKTIFIDELECSIHPLILIKFVKMFHENNGCRSQLIATTHESRLFDLCYLRRDEIWIADSEEENEDRKTTLYSVDRFKEKNKCHLGDLYIEGRFGGIPNILNDEGDD